MSWYLKLAAVVILTLAAVFAYGKFGPALSISSVVTQKTDFFTSTGDGKVTVVPDIAKVSVGFTITQSTIKAAQAKANETVNKITQELKALGIKPEDIQTTNYSVYPQYDFTAGQKITGYQVSSNLEVTVRDMDKTNQVIDTATANGANNVGGIQLTVSDDKLKALQQQARDKAVSDAKTKAQSLAAAAGISLGRIVNVVEAGTPITRPMPMLAGLGAGMVKEDTSTQIQPGSTDITSSVTLYYETR